MTYPRADTLNTGSAFTCLVTHLLPPSPRSRRKHYPFGNNDKWKTSGLDSCSQEPHQRDDPQEGLILLLSHGGRGSLDNCLDELSNLSARAEVIGPIFHQVTGWAHLYKNLYKQNTSPGWFSYPSETFLQHAQVGHNILIAN